VADELKQRGIEMDNNWIKRSVVLIGILLGMVMQYIGYRLPEPNADLIVIGTYILPLSLLWGGMFLSEESTPLRVTLLAIGGIVLMMSVVSGSIVGAVLGLGGMY